MATTASITSLGVGSGMDLEGLITSLMNAQKIPLTQLQQQEASYQSKISALGTLSSQLSSLQSAAQAMKPSVLQTPLQKFASYNASVADSSIAAASAGDGAVTGSYNVTVSQLAQAQKITLGSGIPNAGDGTSGSIPAGTLTLTFGSVSGTTFNADTSRTPVSITPTTNTLAGLRDAINAANAGVTATIVNASDGGHLVLTGQEGANQAFTLSGISGFEYDPTATSGNAFTTTQAAQDAKLTIDGIDVTSSSNTVNDAIDGVSLTLSKTGSTTLKVTQDNTTNITTALNGFISAYNAAVSTMQTQGAYDATTKTAGPLQGNYILRSAQNTLSNLVFNTSVTNNGVTQTLSSIGVSITGSNGNLSLDSSKLQAALKKDPEAVANLVAAVGSAFDSSLDQIVGISGSIATSKNSLNSMVKDVQNREDALQTQLTTIEARYRQQFSNLDTLMSSMTSTSTYLTQQLSALSKTTS
jgi:flagellar hook-associated protein 2